jgi:copper chaperone
MKHRRWFSLLLPVLVVLSAAVPWAMGEAPSSKEDKTTLTVKGMTCGGCVATVKLKLKKTAGVTAYEVNLERGEANVTYDPARTDPKKIASSVSETGFTASVNEADGSSTVKTLEPRVKDGRLDPWEPVDVAFKGCSESACGVRGPLTKAVVQPAAQPGQYLYCPVSGAVFQIKVSTLRADVRGKTLYFCCANCAHYFAQNRDRVLALRGLSL